MGGEQGEQYVIGVDFGTLSGRALVVRVADGEELGDGRARLRARRDEQRRCAASGAALRARLGAAGPRRLPRRAAPRRPGGGRARPASTRRRSIGIAHRLHRLHGAAGARRRHAAVRAATAWRERPHAWAKLWRHHAAQPQADRINELAAARGEPWLARYGGRISCEWEFAKALQLLEEDPELYAAMDRWIEAADWIVWQLCGTELPQRVHRRLQGHPPGRALPERGVPGRAEPRLRATSPPSSSTAIGAARRAAPAR